MFLWMRLWMFFLNIFNEYVCEWWLECFSVLWAMLEAICLSVCLIDWSSDWMTHWLTHWLTVSLLHSSSVLWVILYEIHPTCWLRCSTIITRSGSFNICCSSLCSLVWFSLWSTDFAVFDLEFGLYIKKCGPYKGPLKRLIVCIMICVWNFVRATDRKLSEQLTKTVQPQK